MFYKTKLFAISLCLYKYKKPDMGINKKYLLTFLLLCFGLIPKYSFSQSWNKIGIAHPTTDWASTPALTIDKNNTVYVAYLNYSGKASVMRYDGIAWLGVGTDNISAGEISTCGEPIALATDTNGRPYIAYQDTNYKATVMKYDGSNWVVVGNHGFSTGQPVGINMAIDKNNIPYVVYESLDSTLPGAIVMKYDGTNWVRLGAGLSTGYANFTSIAIAPDGTPYIAFGDFNNGNKATVYKYTGTIWTIVGVADFSTGAALYTSIAIDKNGTPYVAYQDQGILSMPATVMKFNGSSWETVGSPGFSAGSASVTTLALDTIGNPYVSYSDGATANNQATVMKYTGSTWTTVGTAGFSVAAVGFTPILIDHNGIPYVACTDTTTGNARIAVMKFNNLAEINYIGSKPANVMNLFPYPNKGSFTINILSNVNEEAIVTITNSAGIQFKQMTISTNTQTQLQLQLPHGIYFINATLKDEKLISKILIE